MSLLQGCVVECVLNLPVFSMFEIATVLFLHVGYWLRGIVLHAAGGASHFTSGESRCCAFLELALRFRAVIVSVSTSEKPHAPTYLFFFFFGEGLFVSPWICYVVCVVFGLFEVWGELKPFLDHGGHRGSRLDSAAPDCPALCSSEQRVRHIKERHAAYCWSGKKWPEGSPLEQMRPLLYDCFAWCLLKSKARFCVLETQSFLVVMTVCSFSAHLWD